ncbi:MAG: amidohydrolase family protein [Pseudohongiellaceae bacterium]
MNISSGQRSIRFLLLTLAAVTSLHCTSIVAQQSSATHILLDQLRVIVGDGSVLTDAAVLFSGDTIVAVGDSDDMDIPANTTRIDLSGKTLLPALIDAHAHLGYAGVSSWGAQNYTRDNIIEQLNLYAYYGFGAVFSAGSDPDVLALEIQRQQEAGEADGARLIFAAGMAPPGQGPNNQFLVETLAVEQQTGTTILHGLANEAQAREAVQAVADQGIRFIKLWVDDRGGTQEKLSPAIYRAAIAEARRLGIAAVVHQQFAEDMPDLITAGVRGFLHGRLENGFTAEIAIAAQQNNVFIVPNLGLAELRREAIGEDPFLSQFLPAEAVQRLSVSPQRLQVPARDPQLEQTLRRSFEIMLNANVDIVLGTDAGAVRDHPYGYTGHRELEIFVRLGMSPLQAISAATSVAANALGLENSGQIKAGFRADLLILEQSPLEEIRNTRRIYQVYLGGRQVDREAIADKIQQSWLQQTAQ